MVLANRYAVTEFKDYEDFYNNFKITIPEQFNFAFDVMDVLGEENPDGLALLWCDDDGNEKRITYRELMQESNKTANMLKEQGIKKGDFVMVILKRHYEFWFTALALHKIGAILIPATHLLTKKDIVYRCNAASISTVIACNDPDVLLHIEEAQGESPSLIRKLIVRGERKDWISFENERKNQSIQYDRPVGVDAIKNEDLMLVYFTSGTTGYPKMVAHDYTYPLGHIITTKFWLNNREEGIHLTIADTGWAKAVWGKFYGQWLCGTTVFVYDMIKFDAEKLLSVIKKYKVTSFCAPPTMYRFFIKSGIKADDLKNLEYACIAGEPLNPEIYKEFYSLTGLKLREGFGQTESIVTLANFTWMEPRPGSMGKPSPLYNVNLINAEGKPCGVGEEGEIVLRLEHNTRPAGMFAGYYKDDELTNKQWNNGLYHTGDIAWRDEDGYYWYIGRSDDVIKSSGYRIGPFEVESALLEHPAVLETAITAVPDPIRGQVVKASIILTKDYSPSEELKTELQNHVKKVTAPYKYPRIVEFVTELPKTISGKIRRVEIRESDNK